MKVALVSFQPNAEIIGVKYLHAFLRKNGYDSKIILQPDLDSASDKQTFDFIAQNDIKLVGVSLMTHEFPRAVSFVKSFKKEFQNIPLIIGGIHATISPGECAEIGDAVIVGEGEHALLDLVKCVENDRSWKEIKNICYKFNGVLHRNSIRDPESNLDVFPFPQHLPEEMYVMHKKKLVLMDRLIFKKYSRYGGTFFSLMTTRGCPYSCTYCCNSTYKKIYKGNALRKRSVENVLEECREGVKQFPDLNYINIHDDCFMAHSDGWLEEFARRYKNEVKVPFIIRSTPVHFRQRTISLLKSAGLYWASIGLQSGSDELNRNVYKRYTSIQKFKDTAHKIKELNLNAWYDVIVDNPYETPADLTATLNTLLEIPKPFLLKVYSLRLYQGSELHEKAIKDGIDFLDPKKYHIYNHKNIPTNFLIRMTPGFPRFLVRFMSTHQNHSIVRHLINVCNKLNIWIIEPLLYVRLMFRVHKFRTFKILIPLSKTLIAEIMFNKWGFSEK